LAARALWICALLALIAASALGVALPADEAAAQNIGGRNFKDTSQGSGAVRLDWSTGTGQTGYRLNRITSTGIVLLGTLPSTATTFTDNLGTQVTVACYLLEVLGTGNAVIGTSPILCNIVNLAGGTTRPRNIAISGDTGLVTIDWDEPTTPGTLGYLVVPLGQNPLPLLPATITVAVHAAAGPTCYIVLALIADGAQLPFQIGGFSDIKCWVEPASGQLVPATTTPTRTSTTTATVPTSTATGTTTPATATGTTTPATATVTTTGTATLTPIDLIITKTDTPDPVDPGDLVTYTITVANIGQTAAANVTVLDALPAGLTFGSAAGDAGPAGSTPFVCNQTAPPGTVVCTGGSIPGGATRTITLVAIVDNPCTVISPVTNQATVDPSNTIAEGNEANNTVMHQTSITGCVQATGTATVTRTPTASGTITPTATATATPNVDLRITKVDTPDPVVPPGSVQYTLAVTNTGSAGASAVTVVDTLPVDEGTDYFFGNASGTNGFVCTFDLVTTVTCTGGNIGAGGGATITIVLNFTAAACGPNGPFYTNVAVVDPANTIVESNENNNSVTQVTGCGAGQATATPITSPTATPTLTRTPTFTPAPTLTTVPGADLAFAKTSVPNPAINGGFLTYTLVLDNPSAADVPGITINDVLPNQVTFVSFGLVGGGFTCAHIDNGPNSPAGGTVVCGGGTVTAGSNVTIDIVVAVTNCVSPAINTATIVAPPVQNSTAQTQTTITTGGGGPCP
jgi:uncharacterized repeat protein (TIGR01451 family)